MVRKTNFELLEEFLAGKGMVKLNKYTSQYTEIYNRIPIRALKRVVYGLNRLVLAMKSNVPYSLTSIIILEKV